MLFIVFNVRSKCLELDPNNRISFRWYILIEPNWLWLSCVTYMTLPKFKKFWLTMPISSKRISTIMSFWHLSLTWVFCLESGFLLETNSVFRGTHIKISDAEKTSKTYEFDIFEKKLNTVVYYYQYRVLYRIITITGEKHLDTWREVCKSMHLPNYFNFGVTVNQWVMTTKT